MSSTANPRFICRVVRLQIALSGDTKKTTGHAANCPDCLAYFRTNDALVTDLHRDAAQERQFPPDDLAARIALAVRQSTPRQRRSHTAVWRTLAGVTAVVALSVFLVRQNLPIQPTATKTQVATEIHPADVAALVANVDSLRIRFLDSVEPTAAKLATQNPLTQELNSVQADARSALGFLALNFIPTSSTRQPGPDRDPTRS
jgi:hypothetical protein